MPLLLHRRLGGKDRTETPEAAKSLAEPSTSIARRMTLETARQSEVTRPRSEKAVQAIHALAARTPAMRSETRWHNIPLLVIMRITARLRPARRPWRGARFRSWVVSCALLAVVWPSLGSLPWFALHAAAHQHTFAADDTDHDAGPTSPEGHRHTEASDVPGSPTHPADHDCFQCQVLKHLSRCVLFVPGVPEVPLQAGCPVQPLSRLESRSAGYEALLPPVRAPPPHNA